MDGSEMTGVRVVDGLVDREIHRLPLISPYSREAGTTQNTVRL
jgi:hypothetical protein